MSDRDWQAEIPRMQERDRKSRVQFGVSEAVDRMDIRARCRRVSLAHHSDVNGGQGDASRRLHLACCLINITRTIPGAMAVGVERTTLANWYRRRAMPIFEYRCTKCRHVTAFLEKPNVRQPHACEGCGSEDTAKIFSTFTAKAGASPSSSSSCPTGTCPLS